MNKTCQLIQLLIGRILAVLILGTLSAYSQALPSPTAYYPLDGDVLDYSGNGNNGVNNGATFVAPAYVSPQAAQFNGSSAYVQIPKAIGMSGNGFTIAMWVTTIDIGGGPNWYSGRGLVDGEVGGVTTDFGTALVGGKFALGIGQPDTTLPSNTSINDGNWHHVAATWNMTNGAMSVYVDGVLDASGTGPTGSRAAPPSLRMGSIQTGAGGGFLNGTIDDVRLYNSVFTAQQVAALKNSYSFAPQVSTPVASPSNQVYAATTVTLNVTVSGSTPYQYQWQKSGTNISWGKAAALVLTNAMVVDSGNYDVMVINNVGTNISPVLTVTVYPSSAPIFTMQPTPASAQIYQNGMVTFTAAVNGSPPISLQWQHNGTNLVGQTFNSVSVSNLKTNDAGYYSLIASNYLGTNISISASLMVLQLPTNINLNVLTYQNNNLRTGANTNEFLLTPANVRSNSFGKLFTQPVDGAVYAQPLYVAGLNIPAKGTHNVVLVATQHGSVYAFDADSNQGANASPLWQVSFINPAAGVVPLAPADYGNCPNIPYEECIESTPAVDLNAGIIYLEAVTRETTNGVVSFVHRLHALSIATGAEQPGSPVVIQGSAPGTGVGGNGTVIAFDPRVQQCRTGLLLQNGFLYFGYSSQCDSGNYHGWVMAYNAQTLQQVGIYNDTPNGSQGGIWHGGGGMVGDPAGGFFAMTGNGTFSTNYSTMAQYNLSDSFIKFNGNNGLTLTDYFTPYNQANLNGADLDVSAGSPMGLPDSVGSVAHPHLLAGCGKDGTIYLLDRDNLGHFNTANDSQIVQELPNVVGTPWSFPVPAYFNNTIFYQGNADVMRAFHISGAAITPTPVATSQVTFGSPGGIPSVSANGTNNAIVWALQVDAWASGGSSILHAYNATNLAEIYNSNLNPNRDNPSAAIKWTVPTVANGKVYVGAEFTLSAYGNGIFLPMPSISPNGGIFTNAILITLSNAAPSTTIYYTLDGTVPTTNSFLYTGSFILTNTAGVHAMAVQPGAVNSGVTLASFVNSSSVGTGAGLTGAYYANQNQTFNGSPTLVRVDPVINFDWSNAGPDPSIGQANYTVRWTGSVQPQFGETYTFYASADDGVRLWVNGQELVDAWVTEGTTTYQGSITLRGQQLYNLQMDYFQGCCGAVAKLQWSSPSTPLVTIPKSQLYSYTNPPPVAVLNTPLNGSTYTGGSSVTLSANAAAQYNNLDHVAFYANGNLLGSISNSPYLLTTTGLAPGNFALSAVVTDGSGLAGTSAPVNITITAGSNLPYGITNRSTVPAFFNMPGTINGSLPPTLSQVGVFANTPSMTPAGGLIPYAPNAPFWSDGAVKTRWMAVPYSGGLDTPDQQIGFAPTGEWSFPSGTIFVKHFALVTDETNTNTPLRRLETRLLVRDSYGAVYGVTYKWRPDNSDAELLTSSLSENIIITNATGTRTQTWYYPSPSDCLTCHTPIANYVLGVKTRQLNGIFSYPISGVTDNQLRTLNHLGLFNPGIDEGGITNYAQLVSVTNQNATLVNRVRSYIDANCAQCHRPSGPGPSFDARYDTALTNQSIIFGSVIGNLGVDNAHVVNPHDIWRSMLYQRANSLVTGVKMPPLARNLVDSNAMAVVAAWINSLPGLPALPPPTISPAGGTFGGSVLVTLQPPDTNATIFYTLDGSLPTMTSSLYASPFTLTNSVIVSANAFEVGFTNSIAIISSFSLQPAIVFTGSAAFSNGVFQAQLSGVVGKSYVLQSSTNLINWVSLNTNMPAATPFYLSDPTSTNIPYRFYRAVQQP